uniref:Uncharacterized protein n=1 Tax=Romanomermis culicivorax TaxID=13658 RepID=A0A915KWT1_ROMCU
MILRISLVVIHVLLELNGVEVQVAPKCTRLCMVMPNTVKTKTIKSPNDKCPDDVQVTKTISLKTGCFSVESGSVLTNGFVKADNPAQVICNNATTIVVDNNASEAKVDCKVWATTRVCKCTCLKGCKSKTHSQVVTYNVMNNP